LLTTGSFGFYIRCGLEVSCTDVVLAGGVESLRTSGMSLLDTQLVTELTDNAVSPG
jgi:hypothetical protein